jgi:PAS domain S-box-containing protein
MAQASSKNMLLKHGPTILSGVLVLCGLYASSRYNYLLFHSLAELFSILVAFLIFVLVWNTRHVLDNRYLLFIGIASLFSGVLDLIHTLGYKGMGVFPGYDANLATQFWIAFRAVFSLSFLLAPFFIKRNISAEKTFTVYLVITAALISAIFLGRFPDCYIEGKGLTPFKIISEYVISTVFLLALGLLLKNRSAFDRRVLRLVMISLLSSAASELSFTQYASVSDFANTAGHFFELFAYYLIYKAIVVTGIVEPSSILFRNLKQSEEKIRESEERYRSLVELSPDPIAVHSEGTYRYINPAGMRLFGASSPDAIIGKKVLDLVHPEYQEFIGARIQRLHEGSPAPLSVSKVLRLDGQPVDVESTATPITYKGSPAVQVIIRDITDRKRAEAELRIKDNAIATSINGMAFSDLQGNLTYVNQAFLGMWGYDHPGDVLGRPANAFWRSSDEAQQVMETLGRAGQWHGEMAAVKKDGALFFVQISASMVKNDRGDPVCMMASFSDITDRRRAEEEVRKSQALLRAVIEGTSDAVYVKDLNGRYLLFNAGASQVTGKGAGEVIGKDDTFLFPPDEADAVMEGDRRVMESGATATYEETVTTAAGEKRTYLSTKGPLFDETGSVTGLFGVARDISERKRAEEALQKAHDELEIRVRERTAELAIANRELEEEIAERKQAEVQLGRLAAAVESVAEAVVITDPSSGAIQYVNPAFEQITGYAKEEALGRTLHFLDSGKHDEEYYTGLREALTRNGAWSGKLVNKKKDGTLYFEECLVSPVRNQNGKVINYVYLKRDVTEKLRLESIAEAVNVMNNIGYVFSGISHEIGNPVSSLIVTLDLLKDKLDTSSKETISGYADRALSQVAKIEYLLTSLKSFNMYEAQDPQNVRMAPFLDQFMSLVSEDFTKKGIMIETALSPEAERAYADPRALQQVLLNIFTNAADALESKTGPRIIVRVSRGTGVIRIRVEDNGCGMTEEQQSKLFKPFYTTKPHGTGLGMVIIKNMLTKMNGTIEIESCKDEGTSVEINLPEGTDGKQQP